MTEIGEQLPPDAPKYDSQYAYDIAKIITKYNNFILNDKNSLGAFISRLPGYVF